MFRVIMLRNFDIMNSFDKNIYSGSNNIRKKLRPLTKFCQESE